MATTDNLTTRNQLEGTVTRVLTGTVMAEVNVDVNGAEFVAAITANSVERLGLREGDAVTVLVKATEVSLAKGAERLHTITTRNQLPGTVTGVVTGSVMAEVTIDAGGNELVAAVTRSSVERLEIAKGDEVVVLIKATEVMLGRK